MTWFRWGQTNAGNVTVPREIGPYIGADDAGVRWSREQVQRVLYNVVTTYDQAQYLGGDSELLRDAIRIGRETLIENGWWPVVEQEARSTSPQTGPPT
jgi:hypothetical protein